MANVFLKISKNFSLKNKEGEESLIDQFNQADRNSMDVDLINEEGSTIGFHPGAENLHSGSFSITLVGDAVEINCDGIFKINARPQHVDSILNSQLKWYFSGIPELYGDPVGLEVEKYTFKRFGEDVEDERYLIPVLTATSAKEFK